MVVSWFKVFETGFANCVQAPKADLMSSHLSNRDCVAQAFLADYCTSKIAARSKAISSTSATTPA